MGLSPPLEFPVLQALYMACRVRATAATSGAPTITVKGTDRCICRACVLGHSAGSLLCLPHGSAVECEPGARHIAKCGVLLLLLTLVFSGIGNGHILGKSSFLCFIPLCAGQVRSEPLLSSL